MKNYVLISATCILATAFIAGYTTKEHSLLLAAINESNISLFEQRAREVGPLTEDAKAELLKAAKSVTDKQKTSIALWKSRSDKGRIACLIASMSTVVAAAINYKDSDSYFKEYARSVAYLTILWSAWGISYNKLEGLYFSTAHERLSNAEKIETLVSSIVAS